MYIPLFIGNKLKSWPLYLFVTISVFLWVAMTLYKDKIDEFCLKKFEELELLYVSIYVCIKNFLHGFCLFMILVLLAHLSDIENRSGCLVFFVNYRQYYSFGNTVERYWTKFLWYFIWFSVSEKLCLVFWQVLNLNVK